jgi:hypothetical protein
MHAQIGQCFDEPVDALRKLSDQRPHRTLGRRITCRIDQICDALRLCKIKLSIEKGTSSKFAGLRDSYAHLKATAQQELQHSTATVSMQFKNVFSSKGMGRLEEYSDALINWSVFRVTKSAKGRAPRHEGFSSERLRKHTQINARYSHYANPRPPGRRGDGSNGVRRRHGLILADAWQA